MYRYGGGSIRECPGYLSVDSGQGEQRQISELYRAFAVACVEKQIERALVRVRDGDPLDHRSLRDAFTMMLLAGIAPRFRIAFVTDTLRIDRAFQVLRRDLCELRLDADVFGDEQEALQWLHNVRADPRRLMSENGHTASGAARIVPAAAG
jgi:hypothetical protein